MSRAALSWIAAFVLLFAGFGASVLALNSDLYSAHGFVREYLDALARKDSAGALALPGVDTKQPGERDLLTDAALGSITNITLNSDTALPGGTHSVTFAYTLSSGRQQSTFTVAPDGTRLGLFSQWRFVVSPLSTLNVTVVNESHFTANGFAATTGRDDGKPKAFLVLSSELYTLDFSSHFLTALERPVAVTEPSATQSAEVTVLANQRFEAVATKQVDQFLSACAAQQVLMPTGCPFGEELTNRIDGLPTWSIVEYPAVRVNPGPVPGTWQIRHAKGTAHIVVEQKSIFDGSLTKIDEDVPFTSEYLLRIGPNDAISVEARLD